jgi:hypothetical protein
VWPKTLSEACAASLNSGDDAKIATIYTIAPRDRKICRPVKGEALTPWPDGRPGPPLRATAARTLAGTKEWFVY